MIIKSMSRKQPSFGQLLGYIDRDAGQEDFAIRHNVFGRDRDTLEAEFQANAELMQKRKNGVYLFHEIISLTRTKNLTPEQQKTKLREIAQQYIAARCPSNMVYGGLHQDKDHSYHMHLCISANGAGDRKRQRLTKHQFRDIQVRLEEHVLTQYPELEQKLAIGKRSERGRQKNEAELERRTGRRPKREEILERITTAYGTSTDKDSFLSALGRENLELYVRGKNLGVIDHETGKKHRLKTFDLELADQIEIRLSEEAELKHIHPEAEHEISPERDPASQERGVGEKEKMGRDDKATEPEQTKPEKLEPEKEADMTGPVPPNKERRELINKGHVEPDRWRDKLPESEFKKQDKFLTKVQQSWLRTMDDFRGRTKDLERRGKDRDKRE